MTDDAMADNAADTRADTPPTMIQKIAAEAVGTFILVFFGCGSVAFWVAATAVNERDFESDGSFNYLATALAFGVAVMIAAYAFGRISGGHFNPAVSVGAALSGRLSWKDCGIYAGVQVGAALLAAAALRVLLLGIEDWDVKDSGLGTNGFGNESGFNEYAWWSAFLLEVVLTLVFVLVILVVTDERNRAVAALAPLAIGFTLTLVHIVGIPATGTSVNPARSIGPAIMTFDGDKILQLWLFILAPLIGGALAGLLAPAIFGRDKEPVPGSGLSLGSGGSSNPGFTQQWNQDPNQGYGQGFGQGHAQGYGQQQEQPIIQDGWQWDPASQQWIPAQQQAPAPAPAPSPAPAPDAQQGGWAPPPGDQTQVRPPQ
ncbi:MIP family channel protein [Nocardioides caeni]|uniref:MIP family channel protein n=1 Tax=Nocardioides caeni TaxID=574700 RepID=A0A4S8N3V2_9ACTN|nr:MIP family channel protein [Nocardioides caeni]THV10730.1 MIP family channel protein [Nocardioides caeni]